MLHDILLVGAAFLASAVEMVEAMTIVLAVGITRGWRTALAGVAAASVALAVIVGTLGKSLDQFIPIDTLLVVVGILLLVFGMQWLRKAIMRSTGLKDLHDEDRIYQEELAELKGLGADPIAGNVIDWNGFVVSFKGVLLEGLEVAFIVISFGAANDGQYGLAVSGAVVAFVLITAIGLAVHRPLSRVPENSIKWVVGVMLMAFGTFWMGEGVGLDWTLKEGMIPVLAILYWLAGMAMVGLLKPRLEARMAEAQA
jgi:uncharacterized membrane protein